MFNESRLVSGSTHQVVLLNTRNDSCLSLSANNSANAFANLESSSKRKQSLYALLLSLLILVILGIRFLSLPFLLLVVVVLVGKLPPPNEALISARLQTTAPFVVTLLS